MRILMVHPHDIHSTAEPWTRRIKELASEFVKKGHEVRLAYFPHTDGSPVPPAVSGYAEIALPRRVTPRVLLKNAAALYEHARWADIVHLQKCQHYASLPAVLAAYRAGKPLHYDWDDWEEKIWYESCGTSLNSRLVGFSYKVLESSLLRLADTVSVASERLKQMALAAGVRQEDIAMAPVGANIEEFRPGIPTAVKKLYGIGGVLVLYIGQLHGAQYAHLFIRAANIVLHSCPSAGFMIVGAGFREQTLRELARELGIAGNVIFAGAVPSERIPQFISAADVCVAAFEENSVTVCKSPLKIVEYMAMGKAVVASNVGEVRRMLGGAGYLVPPGDSLALANGIIELIASERLRGQLGSFARKRAETVYNWKNTAESILRVYGRRKRR